MATGQQYNIPIDAFATAKRTVYRPGGTAKQVDPGDLSSAFSSGWSLNPYKYETGGMTLPYAPTKEALTQMGWNDILAQQQGQGGIPPAGTDLSGLSQFKVSPEQEKSALNLMTSQEWKARGITPSTLGSNGYVTGYNVNPNEVDPKTGKPISGLPHGGVLDLNSPLLEKEQPVLQPNNQSDVTRSYDTNPKGVNQEIEALIKLGISPPPGYTPGVGYSQSANQGTTDNTGGYTPGYKGIYAGKENLVLNNNAVNELFKQYHNRDANAQELAYWTGKKVGDLENTLAKTTIYSKEQADKIRADMASKGQTYVANQAELEKLGQAGVKPTGTPLTGSMQFAPTTDVLAAQARNYSPMNQSPIQEPATETVKNQDKSITEASNNATKQELPQTQSMTTQDWADLITKPTAESKSTIENQLKALQNTLVNLQKPSQQETSLQQEIDNLNSSYEAGMNKIEDQTIPMEFIVGQQASLQRIAQAKENTLTRQLALAQAARQAEIESANAQLSFANEELARQDKMMSPISVGDSIIRYNPTTGKYESVYTAPTSTKPIVMGEGETLVDPTGKPIYSTEAKQKASEYDDLLSPTEAATLGVKYGTTKGEAALQGLIPKSELTEQQKVTTSIKLANDFERYAQDARQALNNMSVIETGYNEAVAAGLDGSSLNAPSQAVINAFNKMLDPTSVVRESEYTRTGEGQSLWNRISGTYQKLAQGGAGITQAELLNFYNTAKALSEGYKNQMLNYAQRTKQQAENWGLDINNIVTPDVLDMLNNLTNNTQKQIDYTDPNVLQRVYDVYNAGDKNIINDILAEGISEQELKALEQKFNMSLPRNFNNAPSTALKGSYSAKEIANAIKQTESRGNYEAKGGSTETGAYQFMPSTWEQWSKEYAGKVLYQSPENQDKVAEFKIQHWLDKGYNPQQIAAAWNAGEGSISGDKWKTKVGINKYGVKYNTPAYVAKVINNLSKLS